MARPAPVFYLHVPGPARFPPEASAAPCPTTGSLLIPCD